MHVLVAGIYAALAWIAFIAVMLLNGAPWRFTLMASPFVFSAALAVVIALDFAVHWIIDAVRTIRTLVANDPAN